MSRKFMFVRKSNRKGNLRVELKYNSKYVPKGRTDMNNYTDGERAIIGDCVINGISYKETVSRVLNEGSGSTILNKGTFDIVNRIRDYKNVDGVNHWIVNNKDLEYYIKNDVSDTVVEA